MLWSILILTLPARAAMLARLLQVLEPQVVRELEKIELIIQQSDPALPAGENRERMRQAARGEYICFIDDDDLVSPHYVARILPWLDVGESQKKDYIGFNLEQRMDGQFRCTESRSLRYRPPFAPPVAGRFARYRDLSHINPMRRELALRVPMEGWPGDDVRWAENLRALDIVHTEHYVDETLYYYLTRSRKPELKSGNSELVLAAESCDWIYMTKIKVKMLTGIAGRANPAYDLPEHGYAPDEIVELHPQLAEYWIAAGIAEAVKPEKEKPGAPKLRLEPPLRSGVDEASASQANAGESHAGESHKDDASQIAASNEGEKQEVAPETAAAAPEAPASSAPKPRRR